MLLNTHTDTEFQTYLDKMEQRPFVEMAPLLQAAINIQLTTNSVKAADCVITRGEPMLLRHSRKIYSNKYRAVSVALETKAEGGEGLLEFLIAQLATLARRAGRMIRTTAEPLIKRVSQRILDLAAEGKSNQAITAEIRRIAPNFAKHQAATIARTETHAAAHAAAHAAIRHKRIEVRSKEWHANLDKRVLETNPSPWDTAT